MFHDHDCGKGPAIERHKSRNATHQPKHAPACKGDHPNPQNAAIAAAHAERTGQYTTPMLTTKPTASMCQPSSPQ